MAAIIGPPGPRIARTSYRVTVHRPMLPPSIKIVRKLVELTEQILLIMLCGYCKHSRKCHKKSEAIDQ